ncbi:MAG: polysaccharide biosynthesis protein [Lachnospiraceae bacterium]|nr:polysaccharide biosynthesis protein [Lachnospiraceae bacterium]
MTQTKERKDNFVVQAGILAMAGIIVRIIGLLYRSPLAEIIGDEGNGYYSFAYNIYTIILLISSYSIPSAIAKVMAQRIAFGEYRNAHRLFRCALLYVVVVGLIGSGVAYFCAPFLVVENAVPVLRIFAPTIFFSGLLGVLRGYFQAQRTMVPTSVSQILEQILNACVSVFAAWLFIHLMTGNDTTQKAIRGASGSAIGTGCGVVAALLFMLFIYLRRRKSIMEEIANDQTEHEESYKELFKVILLVVTPFILSTFIYNLSTSLNQTIYSELMMSVKNMSEETVATMYGIFAGKSVVITNIPIAFGSAMAAALIPGVSAAYAKKNMEASRSKVNLAIKVTMLISIPSAVGLFVLAHPIVKLLFPQKASLDTAVAILRVLAISVVFYGLSTLTNAVLQGIGKVNLPVWHALAALIVQVVVLVVLLIFTDMNLYALAIANICYSLLMCILNSRAVNKYLEYKENVMQTFVRPFFAAACMGAVAYGVYFVFALMMDERIALIPALLVAVIVYFIFVIKFRAVTEEELRAIPKGTKLVVAAKRLKLL